MTVSVGNEVVGDGLEGHKLGELPGFTLSEDAGFTTVVCTL